MNPGDVRDFAILIAVTVAPAVLLAWGVARWRPRWRGWVRAVVAAAPVPLVVAALSGAMYVMASTASREACGVDACGLAMMAAVMIGAAAIVAYALGVLAAWLTGRLLSR